MQPDVSDHLLLKNLPQSLFYLLEEDLRDASTQGVDGVQELGLYGVEQRVEHVVLKGKLQEQKQRRRFRSDGARPGPVPDPSTAAPAAYLTYGIVDHFESRLFVVVIDAAVAVEDGHAVLLRPPTVAPVHAVVRSVVPLAGEDEETLWR